MVQTENSLRALEDKAEKASVGDSELAVSRPLTVKLQSWAKAAREAVNLQDSNQQKPAGAEVLALPSLPWQGDDLKTALKQAAEVSKALRGCLPKKVKRAPAAQLAPPAGQAPAAAAETLTAEPAPKRRRGKAAP